MLISNHGCVSQTAVVTWVENFFPRTKWF